MSQLQPIEVERAVLSIIVQHGATSLFDDLTPEHFGHDGNRALFTALAALHRAGRPLDQPTVTDALTGTPALSRVGGVAALALLWFDDSAVAANLPHYRRTMVEAASRRALSLTLATLARAVETEDDLAALVDRVEREVLERTTRSGASSAFVSSKEMVLDAMALIDAVREDGLVGFDTGIAELNALFGGWEPGTLNIILGAPGVGKTALWLQSALHVATQAPVALVQLEMTPGKMGLRALANMSRVSFGRMRKNGLQDRDFQRMSDHLGRLAALPIHIAPSGVETLDEVRAWYRRMYVDHGCRSLWIDNMKLITLADTRVRDLDRFTVITRSLKRLSMELLSPIQTIHHMNRGEDELKAPTLRSGYGSSSIEQDADIVLALWRPIPDAVAEVEVLPLKVRDAFGQAFLLNWIGDQQRYASLSRAAEPPLYSDQGYAEHN
ncbi:MAG: AAA family ATPase [Trueperaceae bacterium]|nr:AAA family ATPase [Trueperaceae bacterium]